MTSRHSDRSPILESLPISTVNWYFFQIFDRETQERHSYERRAVPLLRECEELLRKCKMGSSGFPSTISKHGPAVRYILGNRNCSRLLVRRHRERQKTLPCRSWGLNGWHPKTIRNREVFLGLMRITVWQTDTFSWLALLAQKWNNGIRNRSMALTLSTAKMHLLTR